MTAEARLDPHAEAARLAAALEAHTDPAYEAGMRRTVPSAQPAHAVRVPKIRRIAMQWSRENQDTPPDALIATADALWDSGWREERILAGAILGRRRDAVAALDWAIVVRWSAGIDNWEHVDNLAGALTAPMLVARADLIAGVRALAESEQVWQRRLAIVTLIEATRRDRHWLDELDAMAARLNGDRGPSMRKAVDWARRTAEKARAGA